MMNTTNRGRRGEELACNYLVACGYRIIARNYRYGRWGEIDIVAYDGATLAFIEVKYRRSVRYGTPEDSITPSKREQLRRIAEAFMWEHPQHAAESYRFDVVAIEERNGEHTIRLWKNAF